MKILLDENIDIRFKYLFDTTAMSRITYQISRRHQNTRSFLVRFCDFVGYNIKRNVLQRVSVLYPLILELISKPIQKEIIILNESEVE